LNQQVLLALCEYNDYANDLVLGVAERLTLEELACQSSPSHGSVLSLLRHVLATETYFLRICQGRPFDLTPEAVQSLEQLRTFWSAVAEDRKRYLAATDDVALVQALQSQTNIKIRDRDFHFARWQLMLQSLTHSTHHRGELSIVLTELGYPLPTLDIIIHFARVSGQDWPWG
jgi:uncharacterized damage-inducible protein DinB